MGQDLAERFPAARDTFQAIDAALEMPLSRIMFEGPEQELTATQNAQPAILAHSAAVLAAIARSPKVSRAVAAAGHSLGEYSAYVTTGALTPTEAAKLVRRRGELMHKAGLERKGAMAAVLGLSTADVEAICSAASSGSAVVVPANLNSPDQTVISGDPDAVQKASEACKSKGAKRVMPLKVSGAFHSPLMAPAASALRLALDKAEFGEVAFPVIANATAEIVKDPARARRTLADQLTAPVRWVDCMRRAAELAGDDALFVEIGPGTVLAGLLRRSVPGANVISLGTAAEVQQFLDAG